MSLNHNRLAVSSEYSAVNYLPATLKTNKSGWIIEYYVENPQTQELARKRIKLQRLLTRYSNKGEAKKHINNIIVALNMRLSTGWNPFFQGEDSRMYTPIKDVAARYMEEIEKTLRPATYRTYKTFIKVFSEWVEKQQPAIYSSMVSHTMIVRFMDYVYYERKGMSGDDISAAAYNSYIKQGSAFFSWMMDKCYCKENHFQKIKAKKVEDKKRILIPEETREKIDEYLKAKNPMYLIMLKLIYSGLIRPHELRGLKVENLSFADMQIRIPKDVAKNGHERVVPLSKEILLDFLDIGVQNAKMSDYIFGEHFKTCSTRMADATMPKHWVKLRKALNLPKEMQQYSFRDTGMTEMIKNGIDPLSVKQLADHSSLAMTTIYTKHVDPNLRDIVISKTPKFAKAKDDKIPEEVATEKSSVSRPPLRR